MKTTNNTKLTVTTTLTVMDIALSIAIGALAFALYVRTLFPSVVGGDSAEFQVLAYQVGIAHCPGYPVYLLLAKLFTFIPVGDIAYRVNLFSGFMAALAVSGSYLVAVLLTHNRTASLLGAALLAISTTFWSHAVITEVYTAGAAFVAPIFIGLLLWQQTGKRLPLFIAGLFGGISLGVHSTVAMFAPGILLFMWLNRRRWQGFWLPAVLGAGLGFIIYVGAFIGVELNNAPANIFNGAYASARSSWDLSAADVQDPLQRILFIATAKQWSNALFADIGTFPDHLNQYILDLPAQFSLLMIGIIIYGLIKLFNRDRTQGWLFAVALGVHLFINFNYRIGDIYVFYIPGYVLLAVLASVGIDALPGLIQSRLGNKINIPSNILKIAVILLVLAFGFLPVFTPKWDSVIAGTTPFIGQANYPVNNDTKNLLGTARHVVEKLPKNAIVFVDWNNLYIYYYAAHIELGRTDLQFIEPTPYSQKPGLPESVIEFIADNIDQRPIYFTNKFPEVQKAGYRYQPRTFWYLNTFQVIKK